MDDKTKIKELREIVPIPISEALVLLKNNDSDIYKCAEIFKEKSVNHIVQQTNCSREIAIAKYIIEKYDINRTISSIREDIYDKNYKQIDGLTRELLLKVREWFNLEQTEGFAMSLEYKNINSVIETLSLIPSLKDIANNILEAYTARNIIFEGYSDNDPISEYVIRHKRLDDDPQYNKNWEIFKSKTIKLKEDLARHIRNS